MKLFTLILLLCYSVSAFSQVEVRGKVTDKNGLPLIGANVVDKAKPTNGTLTDSEGLFFLTLTQPDSQIGVSYTGYKSRMLVPTGTIVNVTLEEDVQALDGVTVRGFATVAGRARIRAEAIQNLPETTVALTAESLENRGIENLQDFTTQVSNVTFNQAQQPGVNFMTVRGISQIRNGESPVAIIIDGMTLPDASIMNLSLLDGIEMIELVKGPQGTLYGKNAIAGAVNIITKEPSNTLRNKLTLSAGNGGMYGGMFNSSGPIAKNKVYYNVTGRYKNFDGLITNTFLDKKVDYSEEFNLRGKIKVDFSPTVSATLVQDYFKIHAGANYYVTKTDIFDTSIPPLQSNDYSSGPFGDIEGFSDLSNSLTSFKIESYGKKVKFQSVTSYNATKRYLLGENDYSQYAFSFVQQTSNSNTLSQEIRLISRDSDARFRYTLGSLFQNNNRYLNTETNLNNTFYTGFVDASAKNAAYQPVGSGLLGNDDDNTITTIAGFAFFDYDLTDKLTVSAGLRVDYDKLVNDSRLTNTSISNDITAMQPKLSIAYQGSESMLLYANYGKGYRSGGFNSNETVKFEKQYEAEFSNNYEAGIKTDFLNNRIIFNNAFYYIQFENQQQYTFIPLNPAILGIYNFDETRLMGFESELQFRASNNIDIYSSFGLNDGEIRKGSYDLLTNAAAFDYETSRKIDVSGNKSPFTTENTFQIGTNIHRDFGSSSRLNVNLNVDRRGTLYWDPLEEYKQEPYTLVDAKIILELNKVSVTLWSRNLTNTQFNQEFFPTAEFGFNNLRFPNRPRTVGIDLSYKF